ncbi:MAG: anti-sigma factor [Thermoleophilaceae bacterium]|nr:anti-sigma factor [Thermoleophilaceae bacterium]
MSVERHELLQEDVGAYVLGALDDSELRRFEAHLEECPVCVDEAERLRPAAQALPRSVTPVAPPAALKSSLLAMVEAEARERAGLPVRRPRPLARVADRFRTAGSRLGNLRPGMVLAGACVVLLAGVTAGAAGLYAIDNATESEQPRAVSRTIIAKVDKTRVPLGSGSLALPADHENGAVLRVHGLRPLEVGSVYQVWVRRRGEIISQSLFTVGEDGDGAAAVTDDLKGADAVQVTREQAGGAKAPSENSILTVPL